MMQSFQCTACGHQNAFGEPACTQCGQAFIYNCPICGSHINNHYSQCPGCGAAFNWGTSELQNHSDSTTSFPAGENRPTALDQQNNMPYTPPPATAIRSTTPAAGRPLQPVESKTGNLFSSTRFWIILIIICAVLIVLLLIVDRLISK